MRMIFRKTEGEYFSLEGWTNTTFFGFEETDLPDGHVRCVARVSDMSAEARRAKAEATRGIKAPRYSDFAPLIRATLDYGAINPVSEMSPHGANWREGPEAVISAASQVVV